MKRKILGIIMLIRQICESARSIGFLYTLRLSIIMLTQLLPITSKILRFKITSYRCCCGDYIFRAYYSDWWRFIRHFEEKTIAFLKSVVDNKVVMDIGAHIGLHTIHLAKKAKLVISLEPEPNNYKLLKTNIMINKLNNVITLPIAASDKDDYMILYLSEHSGGHTLEYSRSNVIHPKRTLCILARKVDTLLEQLGVKYVDVVKIDVEGHEEKVINGMITLLKKGYPKVLVIETMKDSNLLMNLCSKYGYKIVLVLECWNSSCNYALALRN